jgi:hypothetical protein
MPKLLSKLFQSGIAASRQLLGTQMIILLQHRTTLHYLKSAGEWTQHGSEALRFKHAVDAMHFCRNEQIDNAQIIIRSGIGDPDLVLPVS